MVVWVRHQIEVARWCRIARRIQSWHGLCGVVVWKGERHVMHG